MRVRTGRRIHGHTDDRRREVRPVIEVESAQVVLVGLTFTAMLADDHLRHGLEHFARSSQRATFELLRGDGAFAR